jgi:hypothetical protein
LRPSKKKLSYIAKSEEAKAQRRQQFLSTQASPAVDPWRNYSDGKGKGKTKAASAKYIFPEINPLQRVMPNPQAANLLPFVISCRTSVPELIVRTVVSTT